MRNTHCRTWIMARKLKNVEKETETLYGLENFREILKKVENGNAQCRTWNIIRKLKNIENEAQTMYNREYGEEH